MCLSKNIELAKKILVKPSLPKLANVKTLASMIYHTPFTFLHAYQLKKFIPENVAH